MSRKLNLKDLSIVTETDSFNMSVSRKGQIFTLWDENKTVKQISTITSWSETRISILIDALEGDNFWHEAKKIWDEELNNKNESNKRTKRKLTRTEEQRSTSDKLRVSPKRRTDTTRSVSYSAPKLSQYRPLKNRTNTGSRRANLGANNNQPESSVRIIDSLRKLKDYQGD